MPTREVLMSVEGYVKWQDAKQNLSRGDYMAFVTVADTRLDSFPDPDLTAAFPDIDVWNGSRIGADDILQTTPPQLAGVYSSLVRVHNWYEIPEQADRLQRRATTRANGNSKVMAIDSARRAAMAPLLRQAHLHLRGDLPLRTKGGLLLPLEPDTDRHQSRAQTNQSSKPPHLASKKSVTSPPAHTITASDFAAAAAASESQFPAISIDDGGFDGDDGATAQVPLRTAPVEGIDNRGSGTAHTTPAGSQPASEDEGPLTQRQSQPPSPTSPIQRDGERGGTPISPHEASIHNRETASKQPREPHSQAKDQGSEGGGQGVAGSPMQDTAKRHKRQIDELRQNAKALQLAIDVSLQESTRLRDVATESARQQGIRDEQQRRLNEGARLESATATSSMQLLMQSLQQLRDDAAAQNSNHKHQIEAMRQATASFASASEHRHAQSLESVTSKATQMVMEAQQLAHSQRAAHDEHERNPTPGSSRRAPPLEQSGSHSTSGPSSASMGIPADRQVFGSHRAEEEVVVGPDVRRLYRGPVTEEWIGADG
ncbi:hypothetical protein B484DRAFT_472771, partial [Ochromonadaceae sp. CCMP2298]